MKENIQLMRQAVSDGVTESVGLGFNVATRVSSWSQRTKVTLTLGLAALVVAGNTGIALAAKGCGNEATQKLAGFINSAATFMIAIGGVGALLMFAVGAAMIIFAARPNLKQRGIEILKNAVIGLSVLITGVFLKFVLIKFIEGAVGSGGVDQCANDTKLSNQNR